MICYFCFFMINTQLFAQLIYFPQLCLLELYSCIVKSVPHTFEEHIYHLSLFMNIRDINQRTETL